jgi:small subunit ribosomal protein S17
MTDEETQNEQAISTDAEMAGGETTEREPTEPAAESGLAGEPEPQPEATGEPVGEEAAPSPSAKRKRKRLPRALRPQRTRKTREKPKERRPIVRLPKPEHSRGRRQERQGKVVSAEADKTIVVRVDLVKMHPTYKKVIRRSAKFHAHDEQNEAKVGDIVRIVETRPLSRMKRWRLHEIVEAAK